jgi:hypothetical protein
MSSKDFVHPKEVDITTLPSVDPTKDWDNYVKWCIRTYWTCTEEQNARAQRDYAQNLEARIKMIEKLLKERRIYDEDWKDRKNRPAIEKHFYTTYVKFGRVFPSLLCSIVIGNMYDDLEDGLKKLRRVQNKELTFEQAQNEKGTDVFSRAKFTAPPPKTDQTS